MAKKTTPVVTNSATRCPQCSSTEREPYFNTREHTVDGEQAGQHYTHVVWRRTRCKDCGQVRDDRSYENRPALKGSSVRKAS